MIASPVERTGADFIAFYSAGRIMLSGDRSAVYDPHVQLVEEEKVLGFQISFQDLASDNHPPFLLPVLTGIANFSYILAFSIWAIFLYLLYGISGWLLLRAIPQLKPKLIFFLSLFLFFPSFVSVLDGQDTALLMLGASLWLLGTLLYDDRLSGLGLALMIIRPQIALVLALPFLFNRRKVFWWFLIGGLLLAVESIALVGVKGLENYLHILSLSAGGVGFKLNESAMVNLIGLFRRLMPNLSANIIRTGGWIVFAVAIVFLCILWLKTKIISEKHVGLAVLLALFASPHLHYHDLALLLIPIVCLMVSIKNGRFVNDSHIILFPLATSWLLLLSGSLNVIKYNLPYLLGFFIALILWKPRILLKLKGKPNEILS